MSAEYSGQVTLIICPKCGMLKPIGTVCFHLTITAQGSSRIDVLKQFSTTTDGLKHKERV